MDYVFVLFDDTKERLNKRYNVNIEEDETSEENTLNDESVNPAEVITQISAYYINKKGTLGVFSWAGNTILEDEDEYRERFTYTCKDCGKIIEDINAECECGGKNFDKNVYEYEELYNDITLSDGETVIPMYSQAKNDAGEPLYETVSEKQYDMNGIEYISEQKVPVLENTKIPYYRCV